MVLNRCMGIEIFQKFQNGFLLFRKVFFIKEILFFFINIIIKRIYNSIREGKSEILEFI